MAAKKKLFEVDRLVLSRIEQEHHLIDCCAELGCGQLNAQTIGT